MQPQHDGSLEALAALGFSCREAVEPDADKAHRRRIARRNAELVRLQRGHQAGSPGTATAPRTAPRSRGAGRPARRSSASSTTSSADPGDDGPGEPPPQYVQRFARASCIGLDKVRWCRARHCRAVAYVVDDLQRAKADAAGFGDLCPSCSRVRAAR